MVEQNQFDTIYHEHFSYLSFHTVHAIFASAGLEIFDVEELDTHGGSLRIYAKHKDDSSWQISENIDKLKKKECEKGMFEIDYYQTFQHKVDKVKYSFLTFILDQKQSDKKVIAYGAAAKGNTFLNYCGVKNDLIPFVADASPYKQGKFLPGTHIPVVNEQKLRKLKPDYVLILPWNLKSEISEQLKYIRSWKGKFVVAIPELQVF